MIPRSFSILVCSLLVTLPSTSNTLAGVIGQQSVQQSERKPVSITSVEIGVLEKCVGLNGLVTKSEDMDKFKLVTAELKRRADLGDSNAMYALGREAEHPSIKGAEPDYKAAVSWYRAATVQHDMRAEYHLGELSLRGLGVPRNSMGASWMQHAEIHGYLPEKDRMRSDAEREADSLSVLEGIGGWMGAVAKNKGNTSAQKGPCYVDEEVYVPPPNTTESGHYEKRKKLADPSLCR